ncbi:hypothetical protein D3C80_1618130 [compost metagenome]
MYGHSIDGRHFIYMSINGNLIHTKDKPNGLQIDIGKFLLGWHETKALKIRTGNDQEVVRQAFQYLVSMGYDDRNRNAVMNNDKLLGLLADTDGVIYSILTHDSFVNKYAAVDEFEFDKEVTVIVRNFRPVRKTITIQGVTVYEEDLDVFLKANAIKSAT